MPERDLVAERPVIEGGMERTLARALVGATRIVGIDHDDVGRDLGQAAGRGAQPPPAEAVEAWQVLEGAHRRHQR